MPARERLRWPFLVLVACNPQCLPLNWFLLLFVLNAWHVIDMLTSCACPPAGKYTVFAHVIDGMDVLDKMEKIPSGAPQRKHLSEVAVFMAFVWCSTVHASTSSC